MREGVAVLAHPVGELAPHPVGRELDRGQWVLDLVRDAPRHVAPGRRPLRRGQRRDVVEGEHMALLGHVRRLRRHTTEKLARAVRVGDLDLAAGNARGCVARLFDQLIEFRRHGFQRLANGLGQRNPQHVRRCFVDQIDLDLAIESDHSGGDAREHRLDEVAPDLGVLLGGDQRVALALQLPRHPVENPAQHRDFIGAPELLDPDAQIAGADALGGACEPPDRLGEAFGEPEAQQDRRQDHQ